MPDPIPRLNAALEGRYRSERELGEGGMANVYLARDEKHNRDVALKVLKPELAAVVGAERFLAEIETTANLSHPHILPLFDSGEADGFLFYVMPHVDGETLRDRLDRDHQLPVNDAVQIAKNVAEALDYAHAQGVIHRDIKPANILLQAGKPVISDFGIALAVGTAGQGRLTETGLSMGTPHYMSPEQATGDLSVGAATDIYALGCVLYEMLVGEPPYTGSTAQAILGKIIAGKVASATEARASVPANVDAAIRKALEKVPADRFTGAQDFAKALADQGFRHGEGAAAGAAVSAGPWKRVAIATTGLAILLGAGLGWSLLRPVSQLVGRFELDRGDVPGVGGVEFALSPNGSRIVYVGAAPGGSRQLWQRTLDDLEPDPIPGTLGAQDPVLSPDGLSVAFAADGDVRTVPLQGGPPFTVVTDGSMPSWSADGIIYFMRGASLILAVPATGGEPKVVTEFVGNGLRWPQALPGGRGMLVTVVGVTPDEDRIAVVEPEGGEVRRVLTGRMARYAASGHVVYSTADGTLMAVPFDLKSLEVTGGQVALLDGLRVKGGGASQFTLSETGTLLYAQGEAAGQGLHEFVWVTRSGETLPVEQGWWFDPGGSANSGWQLSPDDGRVVFKQAVDGNQDIWIKELPDGPETRLTFDPGVDRMARWGPDGQTVTFRSGETGASRLWSTRADGTGQAEVLYEGDAVALGFWSPDGEWLVVRRAGPAGSFGARDILGIRPGVDSTATPLVATDEFAEQGPAISPDMRWLAYSSNESGRDEVFVRPFPEVDSGRWQISTQGGFKPVWGHGGRELFYYEPSTRRLMVAEYEVTPTFRIVRTESLFTLPAGALSVVNADFYDVTSDDQRFLMARVAQAPQGTPSTASTILVMNFFEELKARVPN